ncbi:MAG: D-glycero-alpha-D-manno-heptose-1,7-bisphosphate 7-phosphatase [Calditrichia bacterium]
MTHREHPAVFVDRDGTLIEDVGYLSSVEQIKLIPKATEALKILKSCGYKIIVVSNQSGVARGYFDEAMVQTIHREVLKIFSGNGALIDGIYYCPHHPGYGSAPYRKACDCRKPAPGMILQAQIEHNLSLPNSFIIGDKRTDIVTGKNLNIPAILVLTGYGKEEQAKIMRDGNPEPDFIADDIYQAALWIKKNTNRKP